MDPELRAKFESLEEKVEETRQAVLQMRRFFLWTLVITAALIILPLIGLMFVAPQFLDTYSSVLQ